MNIMSGFKSLFRGAAGVLWLLTALCFLCFDILWCAESSFRALSELNLWLNLLALSLLFALPAMLGRALKSQALIITLLALLLECNLLYFRTYFRAIPLTSYAIAGNLADFMPAVWASLRWADLGFLAIVAAAWAVALRPRSTFQPKPGPVMAALGGSWLLAAIVALANGGFFAHWNSLGTKAHMHTARVPMYSIFGSLANDASQAARSLTEAEAAEVNARLARHAEPVVVEAPRRSLVLILCESLEAWPIGKSIDGQPITPTLNALIADSTTFFAPRIVSQVGAGRSIDAQLIINAGLLPMDGRVYAMERASNRYFTLTQAVGGRSMSLSVDKPSTWNQEGVAAAFGIQQVLGRSEWVNDEPIGTTGSLGDCSFMKQAVKRLAAEWPAFDQAFVQFVTYAGHSPWKLPDSLKTIAPATPEVPEIGRYISAARYTDSALAILIDYLRSRPDYKDMLIVITGDHEGLGALRPNAARAYPELVSAEPLLPLIILNAPVADRFPDYAGQIDIYPTLLDMLGRDQFPWRGLGTSLLSPAHPHAAVSSDLTPYGPASPQLATDRRLSDLIITFNLLDSQKCLKQK